MSKEKELAKNTFILFIGTFFTKIVQYFLLPIYTGYLNSSEYGTVELFNTIIYLMLPIVGLQIEQGIFRFLINNRKNDLKKKELISSSIFFVLLSNFIFFIIFMLISPLINYEYKWLLCLNLFLCNLSSIMLQVSRGLGDNKSYSISSFSTALTTILFNIIFLVEIKLKVTGMIYGSAIGYTVGMTYIFIKLKIYKYISLKCISKKAIIKIIKYSVPMIPNSLSWWILSSSDRIIVSSFIGLSATGLLSVAYKFSNIGIFIYNIFNMSLTESIVLHINDDDIEGYFNKIYNSIGNIFISFEALLISFMPLAFKLLINPNYNESYNLISIAIVATMFQVLATMFGTIYIAKKNTKSVAFTSIVAAIINIVADVILIRYIGIYAAVISTVLSYVILFIYRLIDINKNYLRVKLCKKLIVNMLVILLVICPLYYINNIYIKILTVIFTSLMLIIINFENFNFIKNIITNKIHSKKIKG